MRFFTPTPKTALLFACNYCLATLPKKQCFSKLLLSLLLSLVIAFSAIAQPISGTLTVNPAAAVTATNFARIGQVDTFLMNRGINGPVDIKIFNGTYSQANMVLNTVAGASATNTIKFSSFSNDSLQVNIIGNFKVINVPYVIVEKLKFTYSTATPISLTAIEFTGTSENITVTNCNITGRINWSGKSNFLVTKNTINGGVFVTKDASVAGKIADVKITSNSIINGTNDGLGFLFLVRLQHVQKPIFEGNTITDVNLNQIGYSGSITYEYNGMFDMRDCTDTLFITNNKFNKCAVKRLVSNLSGPNQVGTGIGTLSHAFIANNFFSFDNALGLGLGSSVSTTFIYNNVNNFLLGTAASFNAGSTVVDFRNNNLVATKGGIAATLQANVLPLCNYNNYFTTGGLLINSFTNLAAWQTASGKDANSKSVNPKYKDSIDLHTFHPSLMAAGTPAPNSNPLLFDIDNDNRNQINPCIGADEFQANSADVRMDSLLIVRTNFNAATAQPIAVKFSNLGSAILNQLNIGWSVNGVNQSPYVFSGSLPYDSSTNNAITIGNFSFEMGKISTLKVWASMPNAAVDMNNANDTLVVNDIIPYSQGTFTLGGLNPTFTTLRHADSILTRSGVNGPVTINIRNGKYTERVTMKFVRGTNAVNTITIKGENDNAALDTLTFINTAAVYNSTTQSYSASSTIRLDSTAFLVFKYLTIQNGSLTANDNTGCVEFINKNRWVTFENCLFTGAGAALANGAKIKDVSNTFGIDSNLIIRNCLFTNGGAGIKVSVKNAVIKNNRFTNLNSSEPTINISADATGYYANATYNIDSNFIKNETICTYQIGNTCYLFGTNPIGGIALKGLGANNSGTLSHNQLYATGSLDIALNAPSTNTIKVFNNFVGSTRSSTFGGTNIEVQHNSFVDSVGNALKIKVNTPSLTFKNNLVLSGMPKATLTPNASVPFPLIETSSTNAASSFNNNVYFNNDTAKFILSGSVYTSFSNWQNTQLKDVNSKFITTNPLINYYNNYHINANNRGVIDLVNGVPVSYITKDIDDENRSATKPVVGADEFSLLPIDISAEAILGIAIPVAATNTPVQATIRNVGITTITNAQVNWSVNGVVQSPVSFSGSLASGATSNNISLGSVNFSGISTFNIAVWTSNPNGQIDPNTINDSVFTKVQPALCGTYTIGGTSPDFATPSAAMKYAMEAGVSCAVTFNIRNGVYVETDTLANVKGVSATNTLTFQSESGDSSLVKIAETANFLAKTNSVYLKDISYLSFKQITFERTIAPSNNFYFNLININNVTNTTFTKCAFITSSTGVHISNVFSAGSYSATNDSLLTINNCQFIGGQQGILIAGRSSAAPLNGVTITNNRFSQFSGNSNIKYVIDFIVTKDIVIKNNIIDSTISGELSGGISIREMRSKMNIDGNTIFKRKGSTGIFLDNIGGGTTFSDACVIANNMILLDSTNQANGMHLNLTGNTKILHNTILSNNSNSNSNAFTYQQNTSVTIKDTIRNNIFAALRGGTAYATSSNNTKYFSSHNNIYAVGGSIFSKYNGTSYATLAALQTASAMDANTKTLNPAFISNNNLHVGEVGLNAGIASYITTDIDGNTRSLTTPTIGADELVINNNDAGIASLAAPTVPFAAGLQNISVTIRNYGSIPLTTATIGWSVNGSVQTPFNFVGNVAPNNNSVATIIGNYNFLVNTNYLIKIWTSNPNSSSDGAVANDTLTINNLFCALNGMYTVGGTAPTFSNFASASNNLRNGGVLGNVTFNIRDGKYYEQLTLDSVPNQNNFTVTWQGESLDSSKVYLGYSGTFNDGKFGTIEVRRAKNQIIKNITIGAKRASCPTNLICNPSISATHNSIIAFQVKNNNIQFRNNHFIDSSYDINSTGGGSSNYLFINNQYPSVVGSVPSALGSYDTSITIANNRFSRVNITSNNTNIIDIRGITVTTYAGSTAVITNYFNIPSLTLANNTFAFNYPIINGLITKDIDTLQVTGNRIQGKVDIDGKNRAFIDKNYFNNVVLNASSNRALGKPYLFTNNMVTNGLLVNGDRVNLFHNTIAFLDTTSNQTALTLAGSRDTLANNILYNNSYGYAMGGNLPGNSFSNNNAFFASRISPTANTLAQWRAANAGQDISGLEGVNPYFRGENDVHASNILLKAAPQLSAYANDIDGQNRGAVVCYGADEFLQPANDLVITSVSPNKIFPAGINDIKIRVYNNGANAITSFNSTVKLTNYVDDYTATAAGQINYNYSGNIAPGASQEITFGQLNIPIKRNQLKINIINTNGVGDDVPYTDSVENNRLYAGLNGTYTYGVGGNFQNADLLQKQLHFGGVAVQSTISVIAGTRSINLIIDSIPSLAQLIIQSADGDSSNTGFVGQQPIRMFRANNVVFRKLLLDGSSAGNGIILGYNSKNITVENCLIKAATITTPNTSSYYPGYGLTIIGNYSGMAAFNDSAYTIRNNNFVGGGVGVTVSGASVNYLKQVKISGNKLSNQVLVGIDAKRVDSISVDNNIINTNSNTSAFYGIDYDDVKGKLFIQKNKIYINNDGIGIRHFRGFNNSLPDSLIISNNFISVGATSADTKGMSIGFARSAQILFNSILNKSSNIESGAYLATIFAPNNGVTGGNNTIVNNIFYNKFSGIPVEIRKDVAIALPIQHHNLLFTNGSLYGRITNTTTFSGSTVSNYVTLANLAASGVEYSSVSGNPLFISDTDLHVDGPIINNAGAYDVSVKDDIDDEIRNASNPDIGADEFNLPNFGAVQLESPTSSCSHTTAEPVKVWVKNFGSQPRTNIPMAYNFNNGTTVIDTVRTTILPGDSTLFTFTQTANLLSPLNYNFKVWSNYRGDSLPTNDTIKVLVATTPANNVLPYYTGFEGTDAGWYTTGQNTSFKWGVVYSGIIDSAANGLNAWKSNLTGPHNNNEFSYLYSPCIDLTGVNIDPTLNFNLAFQLENTVDKAWVEWSADGGAVWTKLGTQGQGLAWYNNAGNFWTGTYKQWHNAKITLPTGSLTDKSKVRVRFVLQSNNTNVQDGLAIDDVSIYIGSNAPVANGTYTNRTATSTGSATFIPVNDPSGNRIVELNDGGQNLGTITVDVQQNNGGVPTSFNGQTFLGRNFVIRVQNQPTAQVRVRLFITQAEYDAWRAIDPSIDLARNIAVYKFSSSIEDFDLSNNSNGTSLTIQPAQIVKVPYLDGYFLEFSITTFSEFWITKSTGNAVVLPVQFVKVAANLIGNKTSINWQVANELQVANYQIMHSIDGQDWKIIGTVNYQNGNTNYQFTHNNPTDGANYYRIKQVDNNGTYKYSSTVIVTKLTNQQIHVYPTVFTNQVFVLHQLQQPSTLTITTMDGKKIVEKLLQKGTNTLDMKAVAQGSYLYTIITNGKQIATGKIIKQ